MGARAAGAALLIMMGCSPAEAPSATLPGVCPVPAHRGMTDVTKEVGLPTLGGLCLVFADFDGDAWPDLLVSPTNGQLYSDLRLYPNNGDGTFGEHVQLLPFDMELIACAAGDYDNDGQLDVVVSTIFHGLKLFHNDGGLQLTEVPFALPPIDSDTLPMSLAMFDDNGDGYLDLFVARNGNAVIQSSEDCTLDADDFFCRSQGVGEPAPPLVLRNIPGAGFMESGSVFDQPWPLISQGVAAVDWNRDGNTDLLMSVDYGKNALYLSDGMGNYRNAAADAALDEDTHGMGVAVADFDADGYLDLYAADLGPDRFHFGSPAGNVDRAAPLGVASLTRLTSTWSPLAVDLDHNGLEDVFVVTSAVVADEEDLVRVALGTPPRDKTLPQWDFVLYNERTRFEPDKLVQRHGTTPVVIWGSSAAADYDGDGDVDIVAASGIHMQLRLWRNDLDARDWLQVSLRDATHAIDGTRVTLIRGGAEIAHRTLRLARGGLGTSWQTAHFGLCQLDEIDAIELSYPWGAKQRVEGPIATNQRVTVDVK